MHADFGSGLWDGGPIGIPITVVRGTQAKSRVAFQYASESDKGPYPIPKNVAIEGGRQSDGDRHALIVDRDTCKLYELFALYPTANGRWRAGSGAIFDLRSNKLRPAGWTSADAAGLPILPGLARYEDVAKGRIDHALRFTVSETRAAYVWPARHVASDKTDPSLPPMGMRFRLKQNYPIAGFPRQARIVLQALKEYGMIVADNGSNWYVSGAPSPKWSNDQLHTLGRVPGLGLRGRRRDEAQELTRRAPTKDDDLLASEATRTTAPDCGASMKRPLPMNRPTWPSPEKKTRSPGFSAQRETLRP